MRMRMRMISDMRMHIYMHVGMRMARACGRMRHEHGMHSCARHARGMLVSLPKHAYACNQALIMPYYACANISRKDGSESCR